MSDKIIAHILGFLILVAMTVIFIGLLVLPQILIMVLEKHFYECLMITLFGTFSAWLIHENHVAKETRKRKEERKKKYNIGQ